AFFLIPRRPPCSPLFPYTTLFRSRPRTGVVCPATANNGSAAQTDNASLLNGLIPFIEFPLLWFKVIISPYWEVSRDAIHERTKSRLQSLNYTKRRNI